MIASSYVTNLIRVSERKKSKTIKNKKKGEKLRPYIHIPSPSENARQEKKEGEKAIEISKP